MAKENIRPWGRYDIMYEGKIDETEIKVKKIYVNPNQRLSLQSHSKREEYWVFTQGTGFVHVGGLEKDVSEGDVILIPKETKHRAGAYEEGLSFIEVATGERVVEEDEIRFEDDYGRIE